MGEDATAEFDTLRDMILEAGRTRTASKGGGMTNGYHIGVPLKLSAMRYCDDEIGSRLSIDQTVQRIDLSGENGMFGPDLAAEIFVGLVEHPVTKHFGDSMVIRGSPITRFPELLTHFADYRLACWVDCSDGHRHGVIIAQLPDDPVFRSALIIALLNGNSVALGFHATFAERGDAPWPTLEAFRGDCEPTFCDRPSFWIHPAER